MTIRITEATFQSALAQFRACGRGRQECVLFVVEDLNNEGNLSLVHPDHTSGRGGYMVDPIWLGKFVAEQAEAHLAVRAQIHTHPGRAFHSSTDDDWPMIGTAGFVSIVVPNFATTEPKTADLYACRLEADGGWGEIDPHEVFSG